MNFEEGDFVKIIRGIGEGQEGVVTTVSNREPCPIQVDVGKHKFHKYGSFLVKIGCPRHEAKMMYSDKDEGYFCPFCE